MKPKKKKKSKKKNSVIPLNNQGDPLNACVIQKKEEETKYVIDPMNSVD